MTIDLTHLMAATSVQSLPQRLTMTECALLSILDAVEHGQLTITGSTAALKDLTNATADGRAVLRGEKVDY